MLRLSIDSLSMGCFLMLLQSFPGGNYGGGENNKLELTNQRIRNECSLRNNFWELERRISRLCEGRSGAAIIGPPVISHPLVFFLTSMMIHIPVSDPPRDSLVGW